MVEQARYPTQQYHIDEVHPEDNLLTINAGMGDMRKQQRQDKINAQFEAARQNPLVIQIDSPTDKSTIEFLEQQALREIQQNHHNDDDARILLDERSRKKVDLHIDIDSRNQQQSSLAPITSTASRRKYLWLGLVAGALFLFFTCFLLLIMVLRR
jgi:hypothetical protein